jgi:hypothetical protein
MCFNPGALVEAF